ncbi:MAG: hypothetical protein KA251_08795 [Saprospiraceae bacterium]|nr:hypothetical protein [Candidatus Vicinibacter affinis]MBK7799350.1 hypothetical protein [Candidatus Vicinibacter affinis]MBP6523077.1 hypothetical protein [Saprospiraceae bacterium]
MNNSIFPKKFPITEILLCLALVLSMLWYFNDFVASLISALLILVCIFLLIISLAAEFLEKSKTPRWYFLLLLGIIAVSITCLMVFGLIYGFNFDWMRP